jgi:hypothetical protein
LQALRLQDALQKVDSVAQADAAGAAHSADGKALARDAMAGPAAEQVVVEA